MWPAAVAAAIVVAADLALTGLLHVDGLADSADGLLPHLDRARRLEVMATPDVGAFGVATVGAVLLLRWAALATTAPSPLLLGGLWCRVAHGDGGHRPDGAVRRVRVDSRPRSSAAARFPPPSSAARSLSPWRSPVPACPARSRSARSSWRAAGVVVLARRRIGGFTGDVLGASGMVGETAGLVVAAARW